MTTVALSDQEIITTLEIYGVNADRDLCDKIRAYIALLLKWNQKISLTTVTNPNEILRFHFGESLFAVSATQIQKSRLADVGSGAGFPGLAIRLIVESGDFALIESNAKKAAFLSEVVRELHLSGVAVFRGRMEDFDRGRPKFDYITARAIGQFEEVLKWAHQCLNPTGKVILWLGEEDVSVISTTPSWNWNAAIKIPRSERRFLLFGSLS